MIILLRSFKMALRFPGVVTQSQFICCPPPVCLKSPTNVLPAPAKVRRFGTEYDSKLSVSTVHRIESPSRHHPRQRISRLSRSEAQGALFNYLHYTRSLSFTDAEYISKNCPEFIYKLLLSIDLDKNVSRSMVRFLMYNPINEFEPFFESVGLSPFELRSFLPKDMIFLSDDPQMLENFRALRNYGVLPSKIGKIFREAKEVFAYDSHELASKLSYFEQLGLGRTTVLKIVACSPSVLIGDNNLQFVKVLDKLRELGLDASSIRKFLSDKNSYNWYRILDTIKFLEEANYGKGKIAELVQRRPSSIFSGSGKKIYVLFGQLLKVGIQIDEISRIFAENPQILSSKSVQNLAKGLSFLLTIEMEMDVIAHIVTKHIKLLSSCPLKGPQTVYRELSLQKPELSEIIRKDPLELFHLCSKVKSIEKYSAVESTEKHIEKETFLVRLGYIENSEEMAKALKQFRGRGDQLQERFDTIVGAGLDASAVSNVVKRAPMTLNQSKDVILKKIDYLVNRLGYPLETLEVFPTYLCYDMDKINQRFSMYMWVRERGKMKKARISLSTMLACSDARFEKYFVNVDPQGPAMWESLKQSSLE